MLINPLYSITIKIIFLEKKPKIFYSTGLLSLTVYLSLVINSWGFNLTYMPGPYIEIVMVITNIMAFIMLYNLKCKKTEKNKNIVNYVTTIVGVVILAIALAIGISSVEKLQENTRSNKSKNGEVVRDSRLETEYEDGTKDVDGILE